LASALDPVSPSRWSSAYAEVRVMPTWLLEGLTRAVGG
jgi:hypothetical protein